MTRSFPTAARTLAAAALAVAVLQSPAGGDARAAIPNDTRAIVHALNRLAFGARPGDVARVADLTLARWIDAQLQPGRLPDPEIDARLARLSTLDADPATLGRDFVAARLERRRRQQEAGAAGEASPPSADRPAPAPPSSARRATMATNPDRVRERQVLADLAEAKLLRAVYSERQLEEVLVDFWFNHFNVFARKGQVAIYLGAYEREAIRPHVLGRFRDLLGATAKSPAMLVYLDNWMSADPDAASRMPRQPPQRGLPRQARGGAPPAAGQRPQARMMRGLNENYARELLELHTLGVDGGYTQQDVVEVARAFTGWTVGRPTEPGFRFAPMRHDRGAKTILGHAIGAGGGIEDGERVLDLLAAHPATARHIAVKLAQRLVSDTPPAAVVDAAARTFTASGGDLRAVVRSIVTAPAFFAPAAYRAKVKTPFEFVASALRATGAEVRSGQSVVRSLAALGMPLYLCQPPTGYEETAETWVSSGALVNRLNFALAVAGGQMRGVELGAARARAEAHQAVLDQALAGDVSTATRDTMARAGTAEQALALALGSPEFQRQ